LFLILSELLQKLSALKQTFGCSRYTSGLLRCLPKVNYTNMTFDGSTEAAPVMPLQQDAAGYGRPVFGRCMSLVTVSTPYTRISPPENRVEEMAEQSCEGGLEGQ